MRVEFHGRGVVPEDVARAVAHHSSALEQRLGDVAGEATLHVQIEYDLRDDTYVATARLELEGIDRGYVARAERALRVTAICAALDHLQDEVEREEARLQSALESADTRGRSLPASTQVV